MSVNPVSLGIREAKDSPFYDHPNFVGKMLADSSWLDVWSVPDADFPLIGEDPPTLIDHGDYKIEGFIMVGQYKRAGVYGVSMPPTFIVDDEWEVVTQDSGANTLRLTGNKVLNSSSIIAAQACDVDGYAMAVLI